MRKLTKIEIKTIAGGLEPPGPSIVEQLMEMYPFGEFIDGTFYPNGAPTFP